METPMSVYFKHLNKKIKDIFLYENRYLRKHFLLLLILTGGYFLPLLLRASGGEEKGKGGERHTHPGLCP